MVREHHRPREHLAQAPARHTTGNQVQRQRRRHLATPQTPPPQQRIQQQHEQHHAAIRHRGQQIRYRHRPGADDRVVEVAEGTGDDSGQQAKEHAAETHGKHQTIRLYTDDSDCWNASPKPGVAQKKTQTLQPPRRRAPRNVRGDAETRLNIHGLPSVSMDHTPPGVIATARCWSIGSPPPCTACNADDARADRQGSPCSLTG